MVCSADVRGLYSIVTGDTTLLRRSRDYCLPGPMETAESGGRVCQCERLLHRR